MKWLSFAACALLLFNPASSRRPRFLAADGDLPLKRSRLLPARFEQNIGQFDASVLFAARSPGYVLLIRKSGATLALPRSKPSANESTSLSIELASSNPNPRIEGLEKDSGTANYFLGSDPSAWRSGVAMFGRVKAKDVYPGIDLVYYGADSGLEYDFNVSPGVDPSAIRLKFDNSARLEVDSSGSLLIHTREGLVRQQPPNIYQMTGQRRTEIAGGYELRGQNELTFRIGRYDKSKPLVIDPILTYASYFGKAGADGANHVATDLDNNAYIVGTVGLGGDNFDAFVLKLSPDGTVLYTTYLGGNYVDVGNAVAVDRSGAAYLTGTTQSANFPTLNAVQPVVGSIARDAFLTKLNRDGSMAYSTYVGGVFDDLGKGVAVDNFGNAFITGQTESPDFPLKNALQSRLQGGMDAFVSEINSAGSAWVYSTYLGGTGNDSGISIAVDSTSRAYVTGMSQSRDFPLQYPLQPAVGSFPQDIFVSAFEANGTNLFFSSYLGGSSAELLGAIAVDDSGNLYVGGATSSSDFPTANAFRTLPSGSFLTRLNPTRPELIYSTYLPLGRVEDLAVDRSGNVYLIGEGRSSEVPMVSPVRANGSGVIVAEINATGSQFIFSSVFPIADGRGIAIDGLGNVYAVGSTSGSNFPTTANALDTTCGTNGNCDIDSNGYVYSDAFILKINLVTAANNVSFTSSFGGGSSKTTGGGGGSPAVGYARLEPAAGSSPLLAWPSSPNGTMRASCQRPPCRPALPDYRAGFMPN